MSYVVSLGSLKGIEKEIFVSFFLMAQILIRNESLTPIESKTENRLGELRLVKFGVLKFQITVKPLQLKILLHPDEMNVTCYTHKLLTHDLQFSTPQMSDYHF